MAAGQTRQPVPAGLRFVTVAFCDISGSTQLALRFDPQVWHSILEAYFAEVGGALVAAGGRLEKFIGDAVVGVFGADAADEEDARRAVTGALDALDRLAARNDETISRYGTRLSIRFGIASGRVVMADRDSSFAIGSVMNRAARLQAAAPPDGAVVDVRTWLLVRDHLACEPVPPVPAKGFAKPLQAWAVSRGSAQPVAEGEFVNQSEVLSRLSDSVAAAPPGVTVIGLVGEMGSGKTRILRRLEAQAREQRTHTLFISCRRDDQRQALRRLRLVERALGGPAPAAGGGAPSTPELQWRIRRRITELSRQRRLLIIIDDYHHAPEPLRDLLDQPPGDGGPVVFVLAGQGVDTAAGLLLTVPPLSDEHAHELLQAVRGDIELHATGRLEPLVRRSRGNPLFLEQLAALAEEGNDDEVAPSAEAALGARIDRLAVAARHVLGCIGAWGGDLRPGDLDAVCELDEAGLSASLGELENLGLAANRTAAEVAYAHMVLGERARVHTAIARRLQEYARIDPGLLDLAVTHATRARRYWHELEPGSEMDAGATRLAAQCLVAAARQAIGRSEARTAADLTATARALRVPDDALALEIAALESYALGAAGQVPEALARIAAVEGLTGNPSALVHLRVNEMAFGTADAAEVRAVAEATEDPLATARLETWEGLRAARAGDYPRAEELLRSAHQRMRLFGPGLGVAEIYGNLSLFLLYGDTPVQEASARCMELREEVANAPILHAVVSCSAAVLLQRGGRRSEAVRVLTEAQAVFREMGHVIGQAGAHEFGSVVAELSGDLEAARDSTLAAQEIYQRAGAGVPAARCGLRAYVLDPALPPPDLSEVDDSTSWEARVLSHQVAALLAADRAEALHRLDLAVAETAAIRGGGATLIPLSGCLRIARRLADDPRIRHLHQALLRTAPLWS